MFEERSGGLYINGRHACIYLLCSIAIMAIQWGKSDACDMPVVHEAIGAVALQMRPYVWATAF